MTAPTFTPSASASVPAALTSLVAAEGNFASSRSFIHALEVLGESIVPVDFETAGAITTICGVLLGQIGAAEAKVNEARRALGNPENASPSSPGLLEAA